VRERLWYTLSRELGWPIGLLKQVVTEDEFHLYAAHMAEEPPVAERVEVGLAHLIALTFNCHRSKDRSPVSIKDVLPKRWQQVEPAENRRNKLLSMLQFSAGIKRGEQ
jgi:hypothetical protein